MNDIDKMEQEVDRMIKDLEYTQNFDHDNATEQELLVFQMFLERHICRIEQVKEEVEKMRQLLKK